MSEIFNKDVSILGETTTSGKLGVGVPNPVEKVEVAGNVKATSLITDGGTSTDFVKGDGTLDTNTYLVQADVDTYIHDQGLPNLVWTITHNLDNYPSVTVVNTANTVVIGQVDYLSTNQVQITFSNPFAGCAFLN